MIRFIPFFLLFAVDAFAGIGNWDSRISLTQGQVTYVTEAATKLETEWEEGTIRCSLTGIGSFELKEAEFQGDQVLRFVILSQVTVGGETCPGQVFDCESEFTWLGPKEWDVKTACEDPT